MLRIPFNEKRAVEIKYEQDRQTWSAGINSKNQNIKNLENELNASLEFIKRSCRLDKGGAAGIRVQPSLFDKVGKIVTTSVEPIRNNLDKIEQSLKETQSEIKRKQDEAQDQLVKKIDENIAKAKITLSEIVTMKKDDNTGAVQCKARVNVEVLDLAKFQTGVIYKLEKTTKNELYGTVLQLRD
jgi:hypothetical protein